MKKIAVCLMCLVLFSSAFSASALTADGLSARDLSECGVRSVRADRVPAAPTLDGVISSGEYGSFSVFSLWNGAFLTDQTGETMLDPGADPVLRDASVSAVLAFDGAFFYFACTLSLPASGAIPLLRGEKRVGAGFTFAIGLSPEADLVSLQSRLLNQYDFDPDLLAAGGAVFGRDLRGERVAEGPDRLPAVSPQISNRWDPYKENGVTVEGVLWNADRCAANAVMRRTLSGENALYTFEIAVPAADALLSVYPESREGIAQKFASGVFTGSFFFRVPLKNGVFLSNARPASSVFTEDGEALPDAYLAAHPTSQQAVNRIRFLPSPVYFGQAVPPVQTAEPTEDPPETEEPAIPTTSKTPAVTETAPPVPSETDPAVTEELPESSAGVPRESGFSPSPSAGWPQGETRIANDEEEEGEDGADPVSSYVVIGIGLILLAAVVLVYLAMRRAEKAEAIRREAIEKEAERKKTAKIRPRRPKK